MTGSLRRPWLIAALALTITALVGSVAAVAVGVAGRSAVGTAGGISANRPSWLGGGAGRGPMMGQDGAGSGRGMAWLAGDGTAVASIAAARQRSAQAGTGAGLHPGEVIWFDNGFYVELKDASGQPATEVIVDPTNGAVTTEPGPAMMWNTRYSMMGGDSRAMMGGSAGNGAHGGMMGGSQSAAAPAQAPAVTKDQARVIAQQWLATNKAGQSAQPADSYPGYYTLETTLDGVTAGMLSVNAGTGAVWFHTWHGRFIAKEDS